MFGSISKVLAQVPLVEVGGPRLPKMPRIPKFTDKDVRLPPPPPQLGLPTMPYGPGLLPGRDTVFFQKIAKNYLVLVLY